MGLLFIPGRGEGASDTLGFRVVGVDIFDIHGGSGTTSEHLLTR